MGANFTPERGNYTPLRPFRFWCHKVLPLVYDDALSYYELLCKVVDYLNKTMEDVDTLEGDVTNVYNAYYDLQDYVNSYFDSLDVQEAINNKLDHMAETGELTELLAPTIANEVSEWLEENINPTTPAIDATLSVSGAGADAKVVGDKFKLTMMQRRQLSSSDDMDTLLTTGIYAVTWRDDDTWKPQNYPLNTGGTVIVYRWETSSETSPLLRSAQLILKDKAIYYRIGGSGEAWESWHMLSNEDTLFEGYNYDEIAYNIGNFSIYDSEMFVSIMNFIAETELDRTQWRKTSLLSEVDKNRALYENLKSGDIHLDEDVEVVPIMFYYGRLTTSTGETREESYNTAVLSKRLMTDFISTDNIDVVAINSETYKSDIYFFLYDANKTFISYIVAYSVHIEQLTYKILAIPKTCAYIRITTVNMNNVDYKIGDLLNKQHIVGYKYLTTNVYNANTDETNVIVPVGIGNITASVEEYSYFSKRARTIFLETKDYDFIINSGTSLTYKIVIRYYAEKTAVSNKYEEYILSENSRVPIDKTYKYFRLQIYDSVNTTETILDIPDVRKIKLAKTNTATIVGANDKRSMEVKMQQISYNIRMGVQSIQPLTLLHFSDLHRNILALNRVVDFRDYYNQYITDSIHTGDSVGSINGAHIFGDVTGAGNILQVIGNHDTWYGSSSQGYDDWHYLTEAQTYERYIAPFKSQWGTISEPTEKCYYYKDYASKGVRLIVIDCMHETDDQISWFASALSGAITAGLHVVVASHVKMARAEDLTYLDSGFNSYSVPRTTPSANYPYYNDARFAQAVASFAANGGKIACWLCGHLHVDMLATYNNVLNIGVTTAGDVSPTRTYDARIYGTKSYDAFNILGIDTLKNYVSVVRVGLDYNNTLRKMDTFCWDYVNHELIFTS